MAGVRRGINLGCGDHPTPSTDECQWENLDVRARDGVRVRDLRRGIPFDDDSFDEALMDNVLEHFASDDVIFIVNELYRVLRHGGVATIIVPNFHGRGAVQDPTHKSFYVPASATYWNQCETTYGGGAVGIDADFWPYRIEEYEGDDEIPFIRFVLTAHKPARTRT